MPNASNYRKSTVKKKHIKGDAIGCPETGACERCKEPAEAPNTKIAVLISENDSVAINWSILCQKCAIELTRFMNKKSITTSNVEGKTTGVILLE